MLTASCPVSPERGTGTVPTKWQLAQHWHASDQRGTFAPALGPLDAPRCFACGWHSERWTKANPKASWERATLERAHIVPASLGGPDDADNVILLCAPCHQESPDWHEPDAMALWIAECPERCSAEMSELIEWFSAAKQVPGFNELISSAAGSMSEEDAAAHVLGLLQDSMRKSSTHASKVSAGTKVAILRDAASRVADS